MQQFRKVVFWCHLLLGVTGGLIIFLMSVTGVLLTYERQMLYWADTRHFDLSGAGQRLPIDELLAKARAAQNAAPQAVVLRADAHAPITVNFPEGRTAYFHPATGEKLGEGAAGWRNFFRLMTDWHRWLGAAGERRATARAVTGACNLAFLFIVVSGFYLWWPRNLTWPQVRNVLWFRRGLPSKARDFNWHNVIGWWMFVPLFVIVLSGVVISYTWAGNLVYRAAGEAPPAPPPRPVGPPNAAGPARPGNGAPASPAAEAPTAPAVSLETLLQRAAQQQNDWRSISLRLPNPNDANASLTVDSGTGGQPQRRGTLTLARQSGNVVKWEAFENLSKGRRWRSILRFAHTGEVAGLFGQTLAGLASAGAVVLAYTGLALSWRRFWAWRARQAKVSSPVAAA